MTAPADPVLVVDEPVPGGAGGAGDRESIPVTPPAGPRRPARGRVTRDVLLIVLLGIGTWEVIVRSGTYDPVFLPAFSEVAAALPELARLAPVRDAIVEMVVHALASCVIAVVLGVVSGAALGSSETARRALNPAFLLLLSTPKILFLPLLLFALGIGSSLVIVFGCISAFLYVTISVTAGVSTVPDSYLRTARALGAHRRQTLVHVVIPAALPAISVGIWFAIRNALAAVLVAELYVSQGGIGSIMKQYTNALRADMVYGISLVLGAIGFALAWGWGRVDTRLNRWRPTGAET